MQIKKDTIKKILCIKLKGIGDVILSTIVLSNLKAEFPNAKIDFLTEKPSKTLLENLPDINEVIVLKKGKVSTAVKLYSNLFNRKYDLVLDLYSNPRTALITYITRARFRAGFPYKGRTYAYNLLGPAERDAYHAADLHNKFLETIGIKASFNHLQCGIAESELVFADKFLSETFSEKVANVVAISPSGGWESKKCDSGKFAEIADSIVEKYGSEILIVWGPGDFERATEISKLMKHKSVIAPDSTIGGMAALLKSVRFVVANDSGPMHIAAAVGATVLSLHGPTDPKLQGPYGSKSAYYRLENLDCIGCNLLDCNRAHECFVNMDVKGVLAKLDTIVE